MSAFENKAVFLPTYHGCIVCGQPDANPNTLNVRFRVTDEGVEVPFCPGPKQEGYRGLVHGGVMTSLLDETIGWAVAVARKKYFMTAELTIRFLRPLPVGTWVIIKGRSVEHKSRFSIAEGEIIDENGQVYARANGKFFLMPDDQAQRVNQYLTFQEGDLQVLE
jgi:uncharacterized protein (TIGR00369 family)